MIDKYLRPDQVITLKQLHSILDIALQNSSLFSIVSAANELRQEIATNIGNRVIADLFENEKESLNERQRMQSM